MAMADVTIRGAGIFGLTIAWVCARRGAWVQVIDPNGAGAGASGGLVGALAPHVPENWNPKKAFQLESLLMAERFWAEVETASGLSTGYGRTGRLQPLADDRAVDLARAREDSAKALWQEHAIWQVRSAQDFDGWCPPSATGLVVYDTLSGRMHPRRTCAALVAGLKGLGIEVTSEGADQGLVVHATGHAGLLELSRVFGKSAGAGVKGQAALLRLPAGRIDPQTAPQLYADSLHIIPHADGTVAIGSTSEREFDSPDRPDALLDDVLSRAMAAVPQLAEAELLERWAGVRPRSKSRAPMLGPWPDQAGHFIANGGFKIGFGMAPKMAHVMADLLLEGSDQIPQGFRVEDNL